MINAIAVKPATTSNKLTFEHVIEMINDERTIDASKVKVRDLDRKVWVASNGTVGCLSDSMGVYLTKQEAIEACLAIADSPRGMKSALQAPGSYARFSENGYYVYRVEQVALRELL